MVLLEILFVVINEFLKKTMRRKESISLFHYLKNRAASKSV